MRHDFMGQCTIAVSRMSGYAPGIEAEPQWLKLEGRPGKNDVVSGILQLRMTYMDLDCYQSIMECAWLRLRSWCIVLCCLVSSPRLRCGAFVDALQVWRATMYLELGITHVHA